MYCTVLYSNVLYCTLLHFTELYYTVLHSNALYCTVLYCTVMYCTVLHCTVLHCTALYCIILYCTVLYCTVLYFTVLYCIVLTVLNCTVRPHDLHYRKNFKFLTSWFVIIKIFGTFRFPKNALLFEGSHVSSICLSGKSNMMINLNTEHGWNCGEGRQSKYLEKTCHKIIWSL